MGWFTQNAYINSIHFYGRRHIKLGRGGELGLQRLAKGNFSCIHIVLLLKGKCIHALLVSLKYILKRFWFVFSQLRWLCVIGCVCMFVPREEEHLLCVCVCKSNTLISKQVEMKHGKTKAKQIRGDETLFTVDNKTSNKPRNKRIKKYARL